MKITEEELESINREEIISYANKLYEENNKLKKNNEKLKADLKKMKVKYRDLSNIHGKFKDFISCLPFSVSEDGEIE